MGCLHDPANFQQTSSISTCILNTFAGSLLDVCWTFAGSCKHPITLSSHRYCFDIFGCSLAS